MTTYIDTVFTGLIPAKAISRDKHMLTVKITKTVKAYKKGDIFQVMAFDFVTKLKSSGYQIKVETVDTTNLLNSD